MLERHARRREHWIAVHGTGLVTPDGELLTFIEVQRGDAAAS